MTELSGEEELSTGDGAGHRMTGEGFVVTSTEPRSGSEQGADGMDGEPILRGPYNAATGKTAMENQIRALADEFAAIGMQRLGDNQLETSYRVIHEKLAQRLRALLPVADALAVLGQDQAAKEDESAVLLRAALEFEYHAGNRAPHLSNEENRALSDANLRAAVHLRHLARVGFEPVASASPVPEGGEQ